MYPWGAALYLYPWFNESGEMTIIGVKENTGIHSNNSQIYGFLFFMRNKTSLVESRLYGVFLSQHGWIRVYHKQSGEPSIIGNGVSFILLDS